MRWQGRRQSKNVEDRRSLGREVAVGGGLLTLLIMAAALFFPDLVPVLKLFEAGPGARQAAPAKPINDEMGAFLRTVVADNEDVWAKLFPPAFNRRFAPAKLVMFTGRVQSGCGIADAGAGPFYCPLDKTVYIDPTFYEELKRRFGAPGDFAQAYVIAHEFGHHIQNQLGISQQVQSLQGRVSQKEYNKASVRLELQADFLAGVWAHHLAKYAGIVDEDDIREAVNAAAAIGDDRIQKMSQGYVVPDAFTHGSSEQRVRWFLYGLQKGDPTLMERAFEVDTP
jgi:predicted metalloprotease